MDQTDSISKEQMMGIALSNLERGIKKVAPLIDGLTSAGLKRVLKTISHVHVADSIINHKETKLEEEEMQLIDSILALQEDILGYTQLHTEVNSELKESSEEEGESNE